MFKQLLDQKACVITGGSSGIGLSIARTFVAEGASIIITGRNQEKLDAAVKECRRIAIGNVKVIGIACDVADTEDCKKVIETCIEEFGKIDVLVNNAGISEQYRPEWIPDDILDDVMRTNVRGPVIYIREALTHMLEKGSGSIINISSVNGRRPMCGPAYSGSKGALNTITKEVAIRCVGTGVRCNAVLPGYTVTPLSNIQEFGEGLAPADKSTFDIQHKRTVRENIACEPEDQANVTLFFASDLSKAVNGECVVVDNGSYL